MKVLVTGAGGFLGTVITRQLISRGDNVVAFGRGDYPHLKALGVRSVRGDIRDSRSVLEAALGVEAVIHTAAIAGVWGPWDDYHRINVVGTTNVIAACKQSSIPILVHCSSPSVTFDGGHQSGVNESVPYASRHLCHYSRTKAIAEQAVLGAHEPGQLHTAALRPHLIWGPNDPHLFPRLVDRARRGRLVVIGDRTNRIDTVHVENAAAAHLDALDHLRGDAPIGGGRAFFVTQDDPVHCWDWIANLLAIAGLKPPRRKIGFVAAWRLGAALEAVYRAARVAAEPPITRFVAAQLARDHYFDITAAKSVIGYRVRISTAQGLDELRAP